MISYRDNLYKKAENPNKYPWNVSDHSKDKDNGNPEMISSTPENNPKGENSKGQGMMSIKMDKDRLDLFPGDVRFLNWEMLNQLGQPGAHNFDVNSDQERKN